MSKFVSLSLPSAFLAASVASSAEIPNDAQNLLVNNGIPVSSSEFLPYNRQDGDARADSVNIVSSSTELTLTGNSWKALPLPSDYVVTSDTYLTFEYKSPAGSSKEISGLILLDSSIDPVDQTIDNPHGERAFIRIEGTQSYNGSGSIYNGNGQWQRFTVKISDVDNAGNEVGYNKAGTTVSHIVFANDDDINGVNSSAQSSFRNVFLYDQYINTPPVLSGNIQLTGYANNDININIVDYASDQDIVDAILPSYCEPFNNGSYAINGDVISYTPDIDFIGVDSSVCYVEDSYGDLSNGINVSIEVIESPPVAPVISPDFHEYTAYEGSNQFTINMLHGASDPQGDVLVGAGCFSSSPDITIDMDATNGKCVVSYPQDFTGDVDISYYVADPDGNISNSAVLSAKILSTSYPYYSLSSAMFNNGASCFIAYSGSNLDDAVLDDAQRNEMVRRRLYGEDDLPIDGGVERLVYMKDQFPADPNQRIAVRLSNIKGTPNNPIGVLVALGYSPDCQSYAQAGNNISVERFDKVLVRHDGTNMEKIDVSALVAGYIFSDPNHLQQAISLVDSSPNDPYVQACKSGYPNDVDDNNNSVPDYIECLSGSLPRP